MACSGAERHGNPPVKSQGVAGLDLDGVFDLPVAHDIAPQVDRRQVLHGRVGIAVRRRPVVWRRADAPKRALVDAIQENALEQSVRGLTAMVTWGDRAAAPHLTQT